MPLKIEAALSAALARLLATYPHANTPLGLAVSGGGDSMALLHLTARWAAQNKTELQVVTIDHGLRPQAAAEAQMVAAEAAKLGLNHSTLNWAGSTASGNLQNAARNARKSLITDWARTRNITHVLTGHTADDQAETVLMRLARGSGVDGLAGMAEAAAQGVLWLRPLLTVSRADLRRWLGNQNIAWVDDPSNDDPRYDRVKARQMAQTLVPLGLTPQRLIRMAGHMARATEVLDAAAATLSQQAVRLNAGDVIINRSLFTAAHEETQLRLMAAALSWVSSSHYRPRFEPLTRLITATKASVLHGCYVQPKTASITLTREAAPLLGNFGKIADIWDNRWQITGPDQSDLRVGPLGEAGLRQCPNWRDSGLKAASLHASPAIWRGDQLIAAPLAQKNTGWQVRIVTDFPYPSLSD